MSEMITVRDLAMVTSDIQYAQRQGARQLASNLIEIGRLLVEAKTMVAPADWEKYIWDNFGYSTSSADNWMKLYREYGDNQESLFDSFRDSQTFGKLSYTQLLALTALPAEERSAFVESHDVENMSTRQLQQAIRERDEALKAKDEAENRAAEMVGQAEKLRQDAAEDAKKAIKKAQDAEQARGRAEKSEQNALNLVEKLKKQLADATAAEESAKADLKKARENPDIPESIMEKLRREAEASAAEKAAADIQKQLVTAEEKAKEETKAREAAEAAAREAREKLMAVQKSEKLSNPDVMSVNVLGQQMLSIWNSIKGHRMKAVAADPNNAGPIDAFLGKLLDTMRDSLAKEGNRL
ncbi:DUF3102 domain-containing protein [bacterium]|nr:DUF3102 domain-containing protein [bacterium]